MSDVRLIDATLPDFGVPTERPELPEAVFLDRYRRFVQRIGEAGLTHAIVYADREHFANMAYLTGFEPRFEEAVMLVRSGRRAVILTGPENAGLAAASPVDAEVVVYPPFGLLGQDRSRTPRLSDLLRQLGLGAGDRIGVAGWKYFGPLEADAPELWLETPAYLVDRLRDIAGPSGQVVNATAILMAPSDGLRAVNELEQLAWFEFSACHASEAVKRVIFGVRPGMSEFEAAALMGLPGIPLSCHPMLSSGMRAAQGLNSPSSKRIARGEPFTTAVGLWGALTSRAGFLVEDQREITEAPDYVDRLAAPYFACAAEWYETVRVGVTGDGVDAVARRHLGDPFFGLMLNPGHLLHLDEWMNTPIYPGSTETLRSGQAIQCDIIPATGTSYFASNIEDGIVLLDDRGRGEFAERWPAVWARIEARRAFMSDVLHIRLHPDVLPFSNIPAYLPPCLLAPGRVLARA